MTNRPTPSATWLRNLNPRQRKKLRVGEWQEKGFELKLAFATPISAEAYLPLWDGFLSLVESRDLMAVGLGGSFPLADTDAFVCTDGPGSVSEEDRKVLLEWISAQAEVKEASAGELVDAWYGL